MKKVLLTLGCFATVAAASAQLPNPTVSVLPNSTDWFDAFGVVWAQNITQPYTLSSDYAENGVLNAEGLKLFSVKENMVEDVEILAVTFTEYQENENSTNYDNTQLVITLADFQMNVGSQYSLTIQPGAVNVHIPGGEAVPNELVTYSFTLGGGTSFELPAPNISPKEGMMSDFTQVEIKWPGSLGGYDLLNLNTSMDQEGNVTDTPDEITVTFNGKNLDYIVEFEWSSLDATTPGADGDIFIIKLADQLIGDGDLLINIPAEYLRVTDIDGGTLTSPALELVYQIAGNGNIGGDDDNGDDDNGDDNNGDDNGDDNNGDDNGDDDGDDDGGTTGVESLLIDGSNVTIYNLQGNKVNANNLSNGIFIINGRKVVVRK